MNGALMRYEGELMKLEKSKKFEADHFLQSLEKEAQQYCDTEDRIQAKYMDNRRILEQQIEDKRRLREYARMESKELVRTNYGPEETPQSQFF